MPKLTQLGWCDFFENQRTALDSPTAIPARVVEELRGMYRVSCEHGVLWAENSGKFLHEAKLRADLPVVGDWLLVQPDLIAGKSTIQRLFERKTKLSRKAAGTANEEQLVAANVEIAFIVSSLKQEMNLSRLERYLVLIKERDIEPIVLLTKTDLCTASEIEEQKQAVQTISRGVQIHSVSAKSSQGMNVIVDCLAGYKTGVLLGPSGAGKSTLINALMGEELQRVAAVRASDGAGKHTTTSRRLGSLSGGGMIIDTPGVRELQMWETEQGLEAEFSDIEALALQCRFSNCGHSSEPSCKIQAALSNGTLEARRYQNYLKLSKEKAR